MRKTIWFFIRDLRVGGAEKISLSLIKALDRNLYIPVIVTLDDSGSLRSEIPEDISVISIEGAQGNAFQFALRAYLYSRRLRAMVLRERPHLLVTTNWFAGIVASLSAKAIHEVGGSLILEIHVPLRHFLFRSSFGNSIAIFKKWVTARLFAHADTIVAVSSAVADDARKILHIPPEKIRTIRNGIDIDAVLSASRCDPGISVPLPCIVTVGRLEPEKGHEVLLRAFAEVSGAIPHHLVIVGDGSQRCSLERLTLSLNIQDKVFFTGTLENPYPIMVRADFLVLASQWEAFPLVLLEALALQVPIISTKTEGAVEILQEGEYGRLVPVGDSHCLGQEIAAFSGDSVLRAHFRWRGSVESLSLSRMVAEYEELFSQR